MTPFRIQIALPIPSFSLYDYLPTPTHPGAEHYTPGKRVLVPVGTRRCVGLITAIVPAEPAELELAYKPILRLLDDAPVLDAHILSLCHWIVDYYSSFPGDTYQAALPPAYREALEGRCVQDKLREERLILSQSPDNNAPKLRSQGQQGLLDHLQANPQGCTLPALRTAGFTRAQVNALALKGLVERVHAPLAGTSSQSPSSRTSQPELSPEQAAVLARLPPANAFHCAVVQGVTGSGKTEVYLRWIQHLPTSAQVLVLVPEIALTPQLAQRFEARFGDAVVLYHSNQTPAARLSVWTRARKGQVRIVIGTRSSIFLGFKTLGAIIVDEEHDGSFKQQDNPRYHARDAAVYRAWTENIPIVLGSATPSLETLLNCRKGRYSLHRMRSRATQAKPPAIHILDTRHMGLETGLSTPLLTRLHQHLANGKQALLFLNKRGYAPVLYCPSCAWMATCRQCDTRLTYYQAANALRCHHCDSRYDVPAICPACKTSTLKPLGIGTESIEETLAREFPDVRVIRFDRDAASTQTKLERLLDEIRATQPCIIIGTQLLAKGHDFPHLTLVGIVDPDPGLFSSDFRASEKTSQLLLQVAGRAGRAHHTGEVFLQTRFPDHPLIQLLAQQDYDRIADNELHMREHAGLPPYTAMALIRGEARLAAPCEQGLQALMTSLSHFAAGQLTLHGPFPTAVARKKNRFHAHIWVSSSNRKQLTSVLHAWCIAESARQRGAPRAPGGFRWLLDVDPLDTI
ncbi:MAG: primosomal protein N' [Hahellaceae bacterium]|nr:primosomal protein N' [Hahellaceae bacterium]